MDDACWKRLEAHARILRALGHPSRLFIVEELRKGERCVCELTALIGADISTVSRHLSVLKNVGIVSDDKRANQVFYRLQTPCILNFMGCVDTVLRESVKDKRQAVEG